MGTAVQKQSSGIFSLFKNRNFTLMWFAMLISQFGTGITSIAASILVFRETGSALSVGLMLMATSLPGLFFGLIAGVFVDRWDRKQILVTAEVLSGLLIMLIPLLLPQGIWWLYVFVALKSTVYQFFSPAHNSVLPDITSDKELASANSLLSVSHAGATGLGFATAGFITSTLPINWAFILDATTFWFSALLIFAVAIPPLKIENETSLKIVVQNFKEGAGYLWNSPILRSTLFLTIPIGVILGFWNSAMLPFTSRALNATEFEYGLIEGLGIAGFVIGGLVMTRIADRLREGQWLALSYLAMGVSAMTFSLLTSVWLAIIVFVIMYFFNVPSYIARSLVVQRNTTREVRGRVSSVFFVFRDTAFVIGMGLVGIADIIPVRVAVLLGGAGFVGLGVIAMMLPGLRRPAQEWIHCLELLRGVSEAEGMAPGRSITTADMEKLAEKFPVFASFDHKSQHQLMPELVYAEAVKGTMILKQGGVSDAAYFILKGSLVVGRVENNHERIITILREGDFFGEIAALTGAARTANIVVNEDVELLRVPAHALRQMVQNPEVHRLFFNKMMERMMSLNLVDMPRATSTDQNAARALRSTSTNEVLVVAV